ncbi:MAG: YegP family protein [Epsilonproteobacteria bacterium]|nr:YegP family protein [Campylobacterota bacterium]
MKVILKKSDKAEPFSFSFVDGEKTIVRSENYKAKANCVNGIESVKKNSQEESRYELNSAKDGRFYFNLKAVNGQIVGTSPMFKTEKERSAAIATLKSKAPSAKTEEI